MFQHEAHHITASKRRKYQQLVTIGDKYRRGRGLPVQPPHTAQEIVISDKYRFVYVEVRKSASSTIWFLLAKYFGVSFVDNCPSKKDCLVFQNRCSSSCLNKTIIVAYLFFSFVRDLTSRFISGIKQAALHMKKMPQSSLTTGFLDQILHTMITADKVWDHRLETQAFSLSTAWQTDNHSYEIPIDFIRKVEFFAGDWKNVLQMIENHSGKQLPKEIFAEVQTGTGHGANKSPRAVSEAIIELCSNTTFNLIRKADIQDYACFDHSNELFTLLSAGHGL